MDTVQTTCLQRILGLSWENRVTREELYHRANTTSVETILAQRHLRWLGHAIRLPDHRLPKQILYGQLLEGNRSAGGKKKKGSKTTPKTFSKSAASSQHHLNKWLQTALSGGLRLVKA